MDSQGVIIYPWHNYLLALFPISSSSSKPFWRKLGNPVVPLRHQSKDTTQSEVLVLKIPSAEKTGMDLSCHPHVNTQLCRKMKFHSSPATCVFSFSKLLAKAKVQDFGVVNSLVDKSSPVRLVTLRSCFVSDDC